MAGPAQDGEEPGDAGTQDGDLLGMPTQDPFGHLHHDVQAAGLLEGGGAPDDGQDGEDDVDRGLSRLQAETEDEDQQADPGDETEGDPALLRPDDEAGEDDGDLKDDAEGLKGCAGVHEGSPRLGGTGEGWRSSSGRGAETRN